MYQKSIYYVRYIQISSFLEARNFSCCHLQDLHYTVKILTCLSFCNEYKFAIRFFMSKNYNIKPNVYVYVHMYCNLYNKKLTNPYDFLKKNFYSKILCYQLKKTPIFFSIFSFFLFYTTPFFRSPLVRDANFLVPEFLAIQYTF